MMVPLEGRIEACIRTWPRDMAGAFLGHLDTLRGKRRKRLKTFDAEGNLPYWLLLPAWLVSAYRPEGIGRKKNPKFLQDTLWAQYCVFLSVRIQDDLFDAQADLRPLLFVSDQFLIDAERTLSKHFERTSRFWNIYRDCLETSTRTIVEVDRIQQTTTGNPDQLLNGYARISEVLKVGSAAICWKLERSSDFRQISRFCDELAIVGQIFDDLLDVDEDFRRHRFNYVTAVLFRQRGRSTVRPRSLDGLAVELLYHGGLDRLMSEVRRRLRRAHQAIKLLGIEGAPQYLAAYEDAVDRFESQLHRNRVKLIFGPRSPLTNSLPLPLP